MQLVNKLKSNWFSNQPSNYIVAFKYIKQQHKLSGGVFLYWIGKLCFHTSVSHLYLWHVELFIKEPVLLHFPLECLVPNCQTWHQLKLMGFRLRKLYLLFSWFFSEIPCLICLIFSQNYFCIKYITLNSKCTNIELSYFGRIWQIWQKN